MLFRVCRRFGLAAALVAFGVPSAVAGDAKPATAQPPAGAVQRLIVYPAEVALAGPRATQKLIVMGQFADGRLWDFSRQAHWTSSQPQCIKVEGDTAMPLADGAVQLKVEAGGQSATVKATAKEVSTETPVGFATEIIPLLNKLGCNQGACHGAQHGRGGFKISLFGFDPEFDQTQIVKSAEGRRVVLSDPERSILLTKPSLTMEHGGGERMKVSSWQYDLLRRWLEDGAPAPKPNDATVAKLELLPAKRIMQPGEQQQIIVQATWSDGRAEDATRTAQYDSLNDALAKVTPDGLVTANDKGETYIMIRFCGQAIVFQVTVPFSPSEVARSPDRATDFAKKNFIDDLLLAKWQSLGLSPSPACDDATFLRRIYLDTIGTLPSPEEVRAFLTDQSADKRARAIDRVLERPEVVDFWALKWGDLLRNNRDVVQEKGMWSFHNWIRAAIRDNQPLDAFVRDILTAQGSTFMDGPTNYYRIGNSPPDWAETTSQVFLGVRVQCAKCHHHPFEKWSQDDYYGLAAYFARLGTKTSQEFGLFGRETVVYLRPNGEQTHPRKGGVVKPHPLDGPTVEDPFDRRRKLAEWLTTKHNPFFARNLVNRFWGYYMGRGLVEPLDDIRATNPATNVELLDALAKDLGDHRFDMKHLLRTIMNSHGYQLSSTITPGNEVDKENVYFARHTVKRLTAEQMADALDYVTGTQEKYAGLPLGTRAIQLPDTAVRSYFLDTFGRPPRQLTCECERTVKPNIAQALHLVNGDFVNAKIAKADGRIAKLFTAKKPLPEVVEELYLVTLSRPPKAEETQKALDWVGRAANPRAGVEDLLWVLLNSREFVFNH